MSQLKRYNGSSWEVVGGNVAPKTTTTTSNTDTYSCNYINDQITEINADITNVQGNIPEVKTSKTTSNTATYSCTYVNNQLSDTGWVDLSSYVNTSNFAIRSDSTQFKPMARKIGNVVYWRGAIYCTTRIAGEQGILLRNLPSQFMPSREVAGCGKHYGMQKAYTIFTEGNEIHVNDDSTIETTGFWQGYSLSCLGPYTID